MLLELQSDIVYGPIISRRLGRSMGINILPLGKKNCTLNCLYCQYGFADDYYSQEKKFRSSFPSSDTILTAVENALRKINPKPAYITFSGNGESTLHPQLEEIIDGVNHLRDILSVESKTAILSNSTNLSSIRVVRSLSRLDSRIMKLDAGNHKIFSEYNQPNKEINFISLIKELTSLKDIIIQALFCRGKKGNFTRNHILEWASILENISPLMVQIYTLNRSAPCKDIFPLSQSELHSIRDFLNSQKIPSLVF